MAKLLLVEDDELNRDMLSRRLVRHGHEVALAVNGEDALVHAAAHLPEVIVLDLSLPKMDGWEVARRLKAAAPTAAIPIIALTAHALADDRARALAAGCDDYDTKPVVLDRLLSKIKVLIAKAASGAQRP